MKRKNLEMVVDIDPVEFEQIVQTKNVCITKKVHIADFICGGIMYMVE